jgi:hypothetical protein
MTPVIGDVVNRSAAAIRNLIFRRQFLLGRSALSPADNWQHRTLRHGLVLSAHPELDVCSASSESIALTLIGFATDPFHPEKSSQEIVAALAAQGRGLHDVLRHSAPLSGRWVLVAQEAGGTFLFTDPCGFRQVFFHHGDPVWCGSQPEIIRRMVSLVRDDDESLLQFVLSPDLAREESAWVGPRTAYKNCYHLLPNHYLDLGTCRQVRFFPDGQLARKPLHEVVEISTAILRGSLDAITRRREILLPITAGWDSRVLLAASRGLGPRIEYYVDRMGVLPEDHQDVRVPMRLAEALGVPFTVKNSNEDLPGWFVTMLGQNVTDARVLPKTRSIYAKYLTNEHRINVNGNASEICRNFFDKYCEQDGGTTTIDELAQALEYPGTLFVLRELQAWRDGLESSGLHGFDVLDLLYWEQRLGNWGAQYPAEQDIAIDEFSPFNCRLLITTLLSSHRRERAAPDYPLYRLLIEGMWPDALSAPINPG